MKSTNLEWRLWWWHCTHTILLNTRFSLHSSRIMYNNGLMKADVTVATANIVPQSTDVIIKYNIISYWLSTFPFRVYSTSAPSPSSTTYTSLDTIISPTQTSREYTIQYLITANGILYCIVCVPRFWFDNVYFYNYRWKLGYSFTLDILYYFLLFFFPPAYFSLTIAPKHTRIYAAIAFYYIIAAGWLSIQFYRCRRAMNERNDWHLAFVAGKGGGGGRKTSSIMYVA